MVVAVIFVQIILPIFVLIGVGFALDRCFQLDIRTLSKLNFYVFVPALLFIKLLEAQIHSSDLAVVFGLSVVQGLVMLGVGWATLTASGWHGPRNAMTLCAATFNAGNYGLPFIALAFGAECAALQTAVIMAQNPLCFLAGAWLLDHRIQHPWSAVRRFLELPVIYAMLLALACRSGYVALPEQALIPLRYLADGLVPVALLTLGVQLSRTRIVPAFKPLATMVWLRLMCAPLVAAALVWLAGCDELVAKVLIAGAGLPVAVNVSILSAEYQRDENLIAQLIFGTTLLSALTLPIVLLFLGVRPG